MAEWMIGFKVTIGLSDPSTATNPGEIVGFDDSKILLKVNGSKTKKFDYDPDDIQLRCYQFDKRIMFSNELVNDDALAKKSVDSNDDKLENENKTKAAKEVNHELDESPKKTKSKRTKTTRSKKQLNRMFTKDM